MRTLPAWVEVDLDALGANVAALRDRMGPGVKILLIVKADAYGHGAVEVGREAVRGGVHMLGVATVDEGKELREAGIQAAILVLSPILPAEIPQILEYELRITVPDLEFATELARQGRQLGKIVPVHLEVDTGMGRSGLLPEVAPEIIRQVNQMSGLLVEGVYTHFPVSDTDLRFTQEQLQRFQHLVEDLQQSGVQIPLVHASNTAGILKLPGGGLDLVRPGGLIYGCMPHPSLETTAALRRVMSFRARLVQVRTLPVGWSVSYGRDFVTERETRVGVVPVGYGHGLSRAISGRGCMLFRGQRVPILGRVTMDMSMIDLTDHPNPKVGEEVVLFGRQGHEEIRVQEIAEHTGVTPYEVLCGISKRVVRVYKRQGDVETMRGLTGVRKQMQTR